MWKGVGSSPRSREALGSSSPKRERDRRSEADGTDRGRPEAGWRPRGTMRSSSTMTFRWRRVEVVDMAAAEEEVEAEEVEREEGRGGMEMEGAEKEEAGVEVEEEVEEVEEEE